MAPRRSVGQLCARRMADHRAVRRRAALGLLVADRANRGEGGPDRRDRAAQVGGRGLHAAGAAVEAGARGPVKAVVAGEHLKSGARVPAGGGGQFVERLVVEAGVVVHVQPAAVVGALSIEEPSCGGLAM